MQKSCCTNAGPWIDPSVHVFMYMYTQIRRWMDGWMYGWMDG